ncbi:unnamed protein product [Sphagnum troendelagicum]|uniref:EamA domain-containing protein n=1 Tax=Sphagnum troendelagicum TaxID=128251 RepID=A0ABP0TLV0_9BRYO
MAASYNTDDVNHVTKEVSNSIHAGAAPATIDISTSALLRPKKEYSIRTVHFSLAFIHLAFAGLQILARVALVDGLSQYMFTIYRNLLGFVLIGPLAYYVERGKRPQLTFSMLCKFNLLALTGIVGSQQLFLAGLWLTSPLFTAVAQNLIPIFTFLLAVSFGLEEVRFFRRDGIAKVLGTIICIGGAMTVSLYKGMVILKADKLHSMNLLQLEADQYTQPFRNLATIYGLSGPLVEYKINSFHLGIICVLLDTFSWAVYLTLQMPILRKFPAPMTVNAFTYVFGFIQVGLVGAVWEGNLKFLDFNLSSSAQVIAVLYAGIIASGVSYVLQSWCVQRAGPFIASVYNPLQMVFAAALAVLILGDTVFLGTVLGAILVVGGFYMVVYGQALERRLKRDSTLTSNSLADPEKTQITESFCSNLERPLLGSNHLQN